MNENTYYKAMLSRDHRFDGKFFIGVKTTGIYCRPICPAKPKRENVEFYNTALDAETAGYRPCMRCRPECSPSSPAWRGKSSSVQRALKKISSVLYIPDSEEEFAAQFGLSARHLRRLFINELGQTPKQISSMNRLNFSRRLVMESNLSMTSIAFNSGFKSLRRFNDAFKKRFHKSPSEFRLSKTKNDLPGFCFHLSYRPPFNWSNILDFFQLHGIHGIENVTKDSYERVFSTNEQVGFLRATDVASKSQVKVQIVTKDIASLYTITQNLRQMFDLDSDPQLILNSFQNNRLLKKLWKKHPGLRVANTWDPFESTICTILGQLVSLKQAQSLTEQLICNYGELTIHPITGKKIRLFPKAETLSKADLLEVKTTQKRRECIQEVSRKFTSKEIDFSNYQDLESFRNDFLSIKGIGKWTVDYIQLRGLGDTDSFPATDLILKRVLEKHNNPSLENIRPWRSYAAIYFWKEYANSLSKVKRKK